MAPLFKSDINRASYLHTFRSQLESTKTLKVLQVSLFKSDLVYLFRTLISVALLLPVRAIVCADKVQQWPFFIGDGSQGTVTVETMDSNGDNLILGVASTDPSVSNNKNHIVGCYDMATINFDARWTWPLNSVHPVNVYFTSTGGNVLVNWTEATETSWNQNFAMLDTVTGQIHLDAKMVQSDTGGKINHSAITIHGEAVPYEIYFVTNFPDEIHNPSYVGTNTLTKLKVHSSSSWTLERQVKFSQSQLSSGANYQKNAVFMSLGDTPTHVFSLSSSQGNSAVKREDCALYIWSVNFDQTPINQKKNKDGLLRNCVFPTLQMHITDGYPYVSAMVEYMPIDEADPYTGFIQYKVEPAYTGFLALEGEGIYYISNRKLAITGSYNPATNVWYVMAIDTNAVEGDGRNLVIEYRWGESYKVWKLDGHNEDHSFAHITGISLDSIYTPIRGLYAGGTSTVHSTECDFSFSNTIGHVSRIEFPDSDDAIDPGTISYAYPNLWGSTLSGNGDGIAVASTKALANVQDSSSSYATESLTLTCDTAVSITNQMWANTDDAAWTDAEVRVTVGAASQQVNTFSFNHGDTDCTISTVVYEEDTTGDWIEVSSSPFTLAVIQEISSVTTIAFETNGYSGQATFASFCLDSDTDVTGLNGESCSDIANESAECETFDDDDFKTRGLCCSCGGGTFFTPSGELTKSYKIRIQNEEAPDFGTGNNPAELDLTVRFYVDCIEDQFSFTWVNGESATDYGEVDHSIGSTSIISFNLDNSYSQCTPNYFVDQLSDIVTVDSANNQVVITTTFDAHSNLDSTNQSLTVQVGSADTIDQAVHSKTLSFRIVYVNPCHDVELQELESTSDQSITVLSHEEHQFNGPLMTHTVDCGPLVYKLAYTDHAGVQTILPAETLADEFLEYSTENDNVTVNIQTVDEDLIGDYDFNWQIKYEDYEDVSFTSETFKISILPCVIEEIVPPEDDLDDIEYLIGEEAVEVEFHAFTQIPACNYDLHYKLLINEDDIADDLGASVSDFKVEIETNDAAYVGKWKVYIVAETLGQQTTIQSTESYSFEVDIQDHTEDHTETNSPPEFTAEIPDLRVNAEDEEFEYTLPDIIDENDDKVIITVTLAGASDFLEFDESSLTFSLLPDRELQPGNYSIVIILKDDNNSGSRQTAANLNIEVIGQAEEPTEDSSVEEEEAIFEEINAIVDEAELQEELERTVADLEANNYDMENLGGINNWFADYARQQLIARRMEELSDRDEEEEVEENVLQVEISEVTFTGGVTINYSRPVVTRTILNELPESILAIEYQTEVEDIIQEMTYNFTQFDPFQLSLSISFSNPMQVSQGDHPDVIKLSLLKEYLCNENASEPGRRRLGTSSFTEQLDYIILEVPLPQQIASEAEKESIESAAGTAETILTINLIGPLILQLFVQVHFHHLLTIDVFVQPWRHEVNMATLYNAASPDNLLAAFSQSTFQRHPDERLIQQPGQYEFCTEGIHHLEGIRLGAIS